MTSSYFAFDRTGTFKLCYRASGGSDLVQQTNVEVTVVGATDPATFSAAGSDLMNLQASQYFPTVITLSATSAGDMVVWATSCPVATKAQIDLSTLDINVYASRFATFMMLVLMVLAIVFGTLFTS